MNITLFLLLIKWLDNWVDYLNKNIKNKNYNSREKHIKKIKYFYYNQSTLFCQISYYFLIVKWNFAIKNLIRNWNTITIIDNTNIQNNIAVGAPKKVEIHSKTSHICQTITTKRLRTLYNKFHKRANILFTPKNINSMIFQIKVNTHIIISKNLFNTQVKLEIIFSNSDIILIKT